MANARVYVLMGGIAGIDGSLFSRGMAALANRINKLPNVKCSYHYWTNFRWVEQQIRALPDATKTAVVGFSGGASRLTFMSAEIDLAVGYDPGPANEVRNVRNYHRAFCYYNELPNWLLGFRLGGGKYYGDNVETTTVRMNHLAVQYAEELHVKTLNAIAGLLA